jgi:hypothetical protein
LSPAAPIDKSFFSLFSTIKLIGGWSAQPYMARQLSALMVGGGSWFGGGCSQSGA